MVFDWSRVGCRGCFWLWGCCCCVWFWEFLCDVFSLGWCLLDFGMKELCRGIWCGVFVCVLLWLFCVVIVGWGWVYLFWYGWFLFGSFGILLVLWCSLVFWWLLCCLGWGIVLRWVLGCVGIWWLLLYCWLRCGCFLVLWFWGFVCGVLVSFDLIYIGGWWCFDCGLCGLWYLVLVFGGVWRWRVFF